MTVRAAVFHEHGGPEVLRIEEVERPAPGDGEALVRVEAAALNHLDLWVRRGLPEPIPLPHVGGADVAGEVVELGPGADAAGIEVGARVVVDPSLGCGRCEWCVRGDQSLCASFRILGEQVHGGFAEYVVVPAANLMRVPDGYDIVRAAAAPLVFVTAWRGLVTRAGIRPGERVLVTGASGGVATAAVQIARLAGARVYAVTTAENVARVRALGAHVVVDRESADFSREIWLETGKRGVDVVFDSVGAATWERSLRVLARGGRLVTYGATTGPVGETRIPLVFWKQLQILGTTMGSRAEFRTVMELVFAGHLQPVVDVVWPLERIREAHERMEKGEQFGKIVLRP